MGLSASQARLMSLTSRLSDLELRAQQISNEKIRLSDQSEQASEAYTAALDKQTMTVYNSDSNAYQQATAYNLTTYGSVSGTDKYRYIKNGAGQVMLTQEMYAKLVDGSGNLVSEAQFFTNLGVPTTDSSTTQYKYYDNYYKEIVANGAIELTTDQENSSEWLQKNIDAGDIYLYEYDNAGGSQGTGAYENVSWTSGDSTLQEKTDSTQTAKAEAQYETTMASINAKDSRFDTQLKSIDTEHNAIQTEIESVSKVINKNIERGFKIFDA